LFTDWEMRPNASGLPMYFDHQNKVVMLEKPAGQAGSAYTRMPL